MNVNVPVPWMVWDILLHFWGLKWFSLGRSIVISKVRSRRRGEAGVTGTSLGRETLSMEFPGSLNRWDRWHVIFQLARTISLIYHLYIAFWEVICYRSHLLWEPETTIDITWKMGSQDLDTWLITMVIVSRSPRPGVANPLQMAFSWLMEI